MSDVVKKDLGDAEKLTLDEWCRTVIAQCFENDNDTFHMEAKLSSPDGSDSTVVFRINIESINGVKTRSSEEAA